MIRIRYATARELRSLREQLAPDNIPMLSHYPCTQEIVIYWHAGKLAEGLAHEIAHHRLHHEGSGTFNVLMVCREIDAWDLALKTLVSPDLEVPKACLAGYVSRCGGGELVKSALERWNKTYGRV